MAPCSRDLSGTGKASAAERSQQPHLQLSARNVLLAALGLPHALTRVQVGHHLAPLGARARLAGGARGLGPAGHPQVQGRTVALLHRARLERASVSARHRRVLAVQSHTGWHAWPARPTLRAPPRP